MSNINKLDGILAVEDLTDAAAAVVEGGGTLNTPISFGPASANTPSFRVSPGGTVTSKFVTPVGSLFSASLKNTKTGRITVPKLISSGRGAAAWSSVRGGSYVIRLSSNDSTPGEDSRVNGTASITST